MSDFSALAASDAAALIRQLGDAAVFEPESGPEIATYVLFDLDTAMVDDIGQIIDKRPSVTMDRSIVGDARKGFVRVLGARYQIDQPVPGGDDAFVVHRFVRKVAA